MSLLSTYLNDKEPSLLKVKAVRFMAFVKALQSPINFLHDAFVVYTNLRRYELRHNGQVIYLEKVLNDAFDNVLRRIYIDDPQPSNIVPTVLYRKSEAQPTMVLYRKNETPTTSILYRNSEFSSTDFVVFVPLGVAQSNQIKIKRLVDFYKIASKRFVLQTI